MPQAPETRKMRIANVKHRERLAECLSIELRIVARSWHGSHIEHPHNTIGRKQIDEGVDRPI